MAPRSRSRCSRCPKVWRSKSSYPRVATSPHGAQRLFASATHSSSISTMNCQSKTYDVPLCQDRKSGRSSVHGSPFSLSFLMCLRVPRAFPTAAGYAHTPFLIVNLGGRPIGEGLMGPRMVVIPEILGQARPCFTGIGIVVQIHLLIFHTPPQPFNKDVVQRATLAVHTDLDARRQQDTGVLRTGEMAALIAVPDRRGRLRQRTLNRSHHERLRQGLIQFPTDD